MRSMSVLLFVAMFLFCSHLSGSVHAYLDPGTGSIALQLLLGGIVAAIATARMYWSRIKAFVTRQPVDNAGSTNEP
jgi:hypothetical protein